MAGAIALMQQPRSLSLLRGGSVNGGRVSDHGVRMWSDHCEVKVRVLAECTGKWRLAVVVGEEEGRRRRRRRRIGRRRMGTGVLLRAVREEAIVDCTSVMEIEVEEQNGAPLLREPDNNDCIGFGMLRENGSLYRERFVVRFSEVGPRRTTSLETLSCLLQEAACNHVLTIGYGAFHGMNDERLITVTTRMHIEVDRYPAWRSLLEIDTWFCTEGRNAVRRDWTVKEVRTGEVIACATSIWVLMHVDTKTMHRVTDKIRAELAPWVRDPPKWALSEERRQASSGRIARLHGSAPYQKCGLEPLDRDLDMNQHVNNVKYITWTLESIPNEFKENYEVSMITLEYRREVGKGDKVDSLARLEPCDGNNDISALEGLSQPQFIHLIRNQEGDEINKGRTVWRPVNHQAVQQDPISP
ncbi:unnamed protein product [Sphagnum balticum]